MSAPAALPLPLEGVLVLDLSRMLPGAVLIRTLVDLGARVIKIEDPGLGDPMRGVPPLLGGIGAGFCAFFRAVESVCLDLRTAEGAQALRALAGRADVLVESFRPGTLAGWGLSDESLAAANPRLVHCSLSSFGPGSNRIGHDLNVVAESGLLSLLSNHDGNTHAVPRVQIADVTTGLLASSAILAALLVRARTGRGLRIDQPIASGPMPFLTWAWAEESLEAAGALDRLLGGQCPAYGLYACQDGESIALAALEPKFWAALVRVLELDEFAGDGLDVGERGQQASKALQARLLLSPSARWLALGASNGLPISTVRTASASLKETFWNERAERTPCPGGASVTTAPAYVSAWAGVRSLAPAPVLGEGTVRVLEEFGIGSGSAEPGA
ncbi:MAG: CaiB/BaiF CoA-transferase family protein [Thermoanaerobaculia bacterium]